MAGIKSWAAGFGGLGATAVRFGAVGLSATVIYFVLGWCLNRAGLVIEWASLMALGITLFYSYWAQKRFTFAVTGRHRRFGPRFAVATAVLVAGSQLVVWALDEAGLPPAQALLGVSVFYPVASFLIHTFWTFAGREEREG